jgi:succinyl-diaminopimelate desuccinylase
LTTLDPTDPVALAAALIRCPSVTPAEAGAHGLLAGILSGAGFRVRHLPSGPVSNLYARFGTGRPHLCFAGHTDVVPPGAAGWTHGPFSGDIANGVLYGRGACDMKGGVACFTAAALRHLAAAPGHGSISLAITGDEEGEATDGTVKIVEWLRRMGEIPDFCLVGEPSNPIHLGQMVKIGRRGSLNATLTVRGVQGHAAYPHRADNPVHRLIGILAALIAEPLDQGTAHFEPSSLQVTSIDVGNPATNIIPASAAARFNIRFNDAHTGERLGVWLRGVVAPRAPDHDLQISVSGEAFLTRPGPALDRRMGAIARITGRTPALDTGGGTSDARFFAPFCPVAEFGLVGATMHKVDECVAIDDLETLTRVYTAFIGDFLQDRAL